MTYLAAKVQEMFPDADDQKLQGLYKAFLINPFLIQGKYYEKQHAKVRVSLKNNSFF